MQNLHKLRLHLETTTKKTCLTVVPPGVSNRKQCHSLFSTGDPTFSGFKRECVINYSLNKFKWKNTFTAITSSSAEISGNALFRLNKGSHN